MKDYPIGTKYRTRHKQPKECTVVDIYKTYNVAGELISTRYVTVHEVLGQRVFDYDVVRTTIDMGLVKRETA